MSDLTVVPYDFDRNQEVLDLLHRVFKPWDGDLALFNWKYERVDDIDFPMGWIIEQEGKIVAFNGYRPRWLLLNGKSYKIVQSFDTVTDPDCRGQGLFGVLQNQVYERMKGLDVPWVYGWTSEIGYKVFTKKVNWKEWAFQRYLMKVIDAKKFAAEKVGNPLIRAGAQAGFSAFGRLSRPRIPGGFTVEIVSDLPDEADPVIADICKRFGMIAMRSVPYLRWKLAKPGESYQLLRADQNGGFRSYMVLSRRENCVDIDDCLASSPECLKALLAKAEEMARAESRDLIRFRVNEKHPWAKTFQMSGYFWSKTEFRMLGRIFADEDSFILNPDNLHWTFFDRNE